MFLLLYVDDMVLSGKYNEDLKKVTSLKEEFDIKDLEE